MGIDSRVTRSGQNSSGKRTTRSTTTKKSTDPEPLACLTNSRPGPTHKHIAAAAPSSTRGGSARRPTAKRKSLLPSPPFRPCEQEEILDEIIVRTNGVDELDVEMTADETDLPGDATPSSGPGSDNLEYALAIGPKDTASAQESPFQPLLAPSKDPVLPWPESLKSADATAPLTTAGPAKEPTLPLPVQDTELANTSAQEEQALRPDVQGSVQRQSIMAETSTESAAVEKVTTEPAPEVPIPIPAEPEPLATDTAAGSTETVEKQPSQSDARCDSPHILPLVQEHMPSPIQQDAEKADIAAGQQHPAVSNPDSADADTAEQPISQLDIDDCLAHAEKLGPQNLDSGAPKNAVDPTLQAPAKSEAAVDDPAWDEPSAFDDAMQADHPLAERVMSPGSTLDLAHDHSSSDRDGAIDRGMIKEDTTAVIIPEVDPGWPERGFRLRPSVIPRANSHPNDLLPAQDSAPQKSSEEVARVPFKEPGLMNLDDTTISGDEVSPSRPVSRSDHEPDSHALGVLVDSHAVNATSQEVAEASKEDEKTFLADVIMENSNVSENIAPGMAPSALGTATDGALETYDPRETVSHDIYSEIASVHHESPGKPTLEQFTGGSLASLASTSSLSALTDISGSSSKPPSVSSKATTPFEVDFPTEALGHFPTGSNFQARSAASRIQFNVRPKVSIPTDLTPQEYAIECIEAGENSRLNAYALHQEEYQMLRAHISHGQVSTYLNIRNGILRLWVRNPQIAVTREEAIGCAKDIRWFDAANVCFDWLVRRGLINYGCVEIRQSKTHATHHTQPRKRKTVVVIGAGFAGLGCARQLEGLFMQYSKRFRDMGEEPPRVIVLEGRARVGGRVYSRAFETLPATAPGVMRGRRFTAEMGGMIITGFERGNPMNILVRGQLGLPYHCLLADMSLHDSNGTNVDLHRDTLVEKLYNVCLERVSEYKFKTKPPKLVEGNRDLMDEGRDSTAEGHKTIASIEETTAAQPHATPVSEQNVAPRVDLVPVSTNRMTGKVHVEPGTAGSTKAAVQAKQIGWTLKAGISDARDIDLDPAINDTSATLGSVLDNALMQHKDIIDLNAQDFRLFNWHIANLEYSNATNLNRLSSRGWDVDVGNEWDGRHTMVVGGYQSVARGLATLPAPLDLHRKAAVKRIRYSPDEGSGPARITLEDGKSIDADYVVNTIPLGVLKHGSVEFQPPLPPWKTQAIERLGFGVLNKVILVYKEAFWDKDRDIFGMLQTPTNRSSLNQKDYASRRGRFFQWFSVTNTTGMPCLLALMAGDAAYDTEITPNDELVAEATEVLRSRYGARVTQPLEVIVTRWESDRFARGSYSNAGVNMQPEDYQLMARTIGNLYFAGEHTIVTHPATVHGAYLSGLRAASDVLDTMLGPIEIPAPLILPRETAASLKRKAQEEQRDPRQARLEAYEMEIIEYIHSTIGHHPLKPAKVAGNPYILFNKANYEEGRKKCEEGRRTGKGKPSPNEVRTMTSKMWKESSLEVRKPFEDAAEQQKRCFSMALKAWVEAATKWERDAAALREKFVREHPSMPGPEELAGGHGDWAGARRAKRLVESYRETDSDVEMD